MEWGKELDARHFAGTVILLAGQLLYIGECVADSLQHTFGARISTEYDSNPAMTQSHSEGVWRAMFDPSYSLMGTIGESELTAGIALLLVRSSNKFLSPNRDNPSAFINWLRPIESGEFGLSSRYSEVATRDAGGVDATGQVPVTSTNATRTLSGNWKNELSERSTLSADVAYEAVAYKGGTYTDYSSRSGGLNFGYRLSEQTSSFFQVTGNKLLPSEGGSSSTLYVATVGANWQVEFIDWLVQAGKTKVGANSDTQGSIEMRYTGQRSQLTLNAGRSVSPSGLGGFVKADHARGGWSYTLSEYSNAGIDLDRQKNLSTSTSPTAITDNSRVWIDHDFTSQWSLQTFYQRRTTREGSAKSISSNMLGLSIVYSHPDL